MTRWSGSSGILGARGGTRLRAAPAELKPGELRLLIMRMGHALRRFQRERGVTLSRPMAADSPLQSYFVDPDFAAAAMSEVLGGALASNPASISIAAPSGWAIQPVKDSGVAGSLTSATWPGARSTGMVRPSSVPWEWLSSTLTWLRTAPVAFSTAPTKELLAGS